MAWSRRLALLGLAASSLLAGASALCQTTADKPDPPPVGQLTERVVCRHEPSQSYALYLPSAYSPERAWPILYVFDPGARGTVAARLFSEAAERLGYIVAASNNSHNGPSAIAVAALEAMWLDTHQRLSIDPRRVYTSGMSGGTAPALWLAISHGAGIIACAGPIQLSDVAKFDKTFTWLGVAGDADFNLDANRDAVASLRKRGVTARLVPFNGGHGWPPEDVAARCLEWLELGAMRSGRRPPDPTFVERMQQQGLARARDLIAQGQLGAAAEESEDLARELAGLVPVEAFEAEARRLRATPDARRQAKHVKALAAKYRDENARLTELRQVLEADAAGGTVKASQGLAALAEIDSVRKARLELLQSVERLQRDAETATDRETRLAARRVLEGFHAETVYTGRHYRVTRRFDAARADFELCETMRPKSWSPAYELARTAAARGDKKKALAELRRAIDLGFAYAGLLTEDEEWKDLADLPELKAVIEELRARPAR